MMVSMTMSAFGLGIITDRPLLTRRVDRARLKSFMIDGILGGLVLRAIIEVECHQGRQRRFEDFLLVVVGERFSYVWRGLSITGNT